MRAVQYNSSPAVVEALIKNGADIHAKDGYNETALIWAVKETNNPAVIQILLDNGANVNDLNKFGDSALMLAVRLNKVNVVLVLLGTERCFLGVHVVVVQVVRFLVCHP